MDHSLGDSLPMHHVIDAEDAILFSGVEDRVVEWLEEHLKSDFQPLWVFIEPIGDIITASQFLDLAT